MGEYKNLYYNRSAGHNNLLEIIKQKRYYPTYPIKHLQERYKTAVEVSLMIEDMIFVKKVYHAFPIKDLVADHIILTNKNIYLIANFTAKLKKIHVFDNFISTETNIDRDYISDMIAMRELLSTKLEIPSDKIVTVLVVDSLELKANINVKIDIVTSLQNLSYEVTKYEGIDKELIDVYHYTSLFEEEALWEAGEGEIISSDLLREVEKLVENNSFLRKSKLKSSKPYIKKRKKLLILSLLTLLFGLTFHSYSERFKESYEIISGSSFISSRIDLASFGLNSRAEPKYDKVQDEKLCPDLDNCRVGERTVNGDIIFYDAGTMENWGRYLVMPTYEYLLKDLSPKEICEINTGALYPEYLTDFRGGDSTMHRVNNNIFLASHCPNVVDLYSSKELENLNANDYLVPTYEEAEKLVRYIEDLKKPGMLMLNENNFLTSSMSENGLKVISNKGNGKVTVVLVRAVHE